MAQQFRCEASIVSLFADGSRAISRAGVSHEVVLHALACVVVLMFVILEWCAVIVLLVPPVAEVYYAHLFRFFLVAYVRDVLFSGRDRV